jgi:hypothetical protein
MEKPLAWLKGEIKTPPFSRNARIEAGYLLRRLGIFDKKTATTPKSIVDDCRRRQRHYDENMR